MRSASRLKSSVESTRAYGRGRYERAGVKRYEPSELARRRSEPSVAVRCQRMGRRGSGSDSETAAADGTEGSEEDEGRPRRMTNSGSAAVKRRAASGRRSVRSWSSTAVLVRSCSPSKRARSCVAEASPGMSRLKVPHSRRRLSGTAGVLDAGRLGVPPDGGGRGAAST